MKRKQIAILVGVMVLLLASGTQIVAQAAGNKDKDKEKMSFKAVLGGYDRVPPNSTPATGEFKAKLSRDETTLDFELSYENLTGLPTDLHLQFGQIYVNGGVIAHLCHENPCPNSTSGVVTGHLSASDVVGPTTEGIAVGDFASVLKAMRAGMTYINLHSVVFPGGEIRGQVK